MNKEILLAVRTAITIHDSQFDYGGWMYTPASATLHPNNTLECGTCGCVAGFTAMICGEGKRSTTETVMEKATRLLDLTPDQAKFLFIPWHTHDTKLERELFWYTDEEKNHTRQVTEALARIDWLLGDNDISQFVSPLLGDRDENGNLLPLPDYTTPYPNNH